MISTQMGEQLDRGKTNTRRKIIFKLITLGALHPSNHHPFPQATDPRMRGDENVSSNRFKEP